MMSEEAIKQIEKVWNELGTEHILTSFELGCVPLIAQIYKDPSDEGVSIMVELAKVNQRIHAYINERYIGDELNSLVEELAEE